MKNTAMAALGFVLTLAIYLVLPRAYPPEAEVESPLVMGASSAKGGVLQRVMPSAANLEPVEPLGLLWPLEGRRAGRGYGWRRGAFDPSKEVFHNGVDAVAPTGTPIRAASSGVVETARWLGACGYGVILRHDPPRIPRRRETTTYCHLSKIAVARGERVEEGQTIGEVGSTGASTTPHLHLRLDVSRKHLDPVPHFREIPR